MTQKPWFNVLLAQAVFLREDYPKDRFAQPIGNWLHANRHASAPIPVLIQQRFFLSQFLQP